MEDVSWYAKSVGQEKEIRNIENINRNLFIT
jgi:hypothetical protein